MTSNLTQNLDSSRDIAPEGNDLAETNANLDEIVELALELQKESGIRPLWGTAQLFKHPRYMHGAATGVKYKAVWGTQKIYMYLRQY